MAALMDVAVPYIPELMCQGEYLLRVFTAMVLGLMIGNERKNRNKSAGLRTHAIVALGSALMMVVSKYGFSDVAQGDGARLAAQVVSGVGFLGAGMIFVRNNQVSGLTTAAGIWTTAGVGLTVGAGMYGVGILATVMLVLVQNVLHTVSGKVPTGGMIRITALDRHDQLAALSSSLACWDVEIQSLRLRKQKKGRMTMEFEVLYPPKTDKGAFLASLIQLEGVLSVGG